MVQVELDNKDLAEELAKSIELIDGITQRLRTAQNGDPRKNQLASHIIQTLNLARSYTLEKIPGLALLRLTASPEITENLTIKDAVSFEEVVIVEEPVVVRSSEVFREPKAVTSPLYPQTMAERMAELNFDPRSVSNWEMKEHMILAGLANDNRNVFEGEFARIHQLWADGKFPNVQSEQQLVEYAAMATFARVGERDHKSPSSNSVIPAVGKPVVKSPAQSLPRPPQFIENEDEEKVKPRNYWDGDENLEPADE